MESSKNKVAQVILAAKENMRRKFWDDHMEIKNGMGFTKVISKEEFQKWCIENDLDPQRISSQIMYMNEIRHPSDVE